MIRKKNNISEKLFFMLGVFATIQLLSIARLTVFNIIMILTTVVCFLLNARRLKVDKYFLFSVIATLLTLFLSICNGDLSSGFRKSALVGGISYFFVLALYLIMNTKLNYASKLIKGFEISCMLTLIWCMFQLVFYYLLNIDVNTLLFEKILRIANARGDYYNGALIPSGFYSHRAILMPSFIYMFFSTSNPYLMFVIILIGCLTRSTALIMGLLLALFFRVCISYVNSIYKRFSKKKLIMVLSVVIIAFFGMLICNSKISELVGYIFMRIADSTSNKADNSSVVHFLYYKSLLPIIQKTNIGNFLFGTGFGTSGQHYTWFNGQYANLEKWVVESDYINILLSQGLVGLLLWGYILFRIIVLSHKYKYWENIAFVLIITFVGIMYNIQFTWFIVVELAMLVLTKNKIRVFNYKEERKGKLEYDLYNYAQKI